MSHSDQVTTVDGLIVALGGIKSNRLDEKIWRIFSVGKARAPSKNILTIISDDPEATPKKYSRILERFETVRTWEPMLTARFASTKSKSAETRQFPESARTRIRQFLEDFRGFCPFSMRRLLIRSSTLRSDSASGHSVAVEESVHETGPSPTRSGLKNHIYQIVDGQIEGLDRVAPRDELKDEFGPPMVTFNSPGALGQPCVGLRTLLGVQPCLA